MGERPRKVSSFRIAEIISENPQSVEAHKDKVNVEFEETFRRFWKQDDIVLHVNRDGN